MNIEVGMKFKVVWIGHESCYKGRIYKAKKIYKDCTCTKPSWLFPNSNPPPRQKHIHILADMVECPYEGIEKKDYLFGCIDENTLKDVDDPDGYWIETIPTAGIQLTLF